MPTERKPAPVETDFNREYIQTIRLFKEFPLWFIALMFIGFSRCCTAGQLFRWLEEYEEDWLKCIAAIGKLITKKLVRKLTRTELKRLELPEDCIIFYPTELGFLEVDARSVWSYNPGDLLRDQFSHGNPCHTKYPRVVHQLTCAGSLLLILEDYHFVWYESERQLQRKIKQEVSRRKKAGSSPLEILSSGDYKVRLLNTATGDYWDMECEIINEMSASQIKKKPTGVYLFCNSEEKWGVVKQATSKDAVVVGNFFEPDWVTEKLKDEYYSKDTRREVQNSLLDQIRLYGGVATSKLLALLNPLKGEEFYRSKLEELYDQERLDKMSGCLVPGTSRGRNVNFYCLPELEVENNYLAFRNGVFRCYTFQMVSKMFAFVEYLEEPDGLVFTHDKVTFLVINDQEYESLESNLFRYLEIQSQYTSYNVVLVCTDANRLRFYKKEKRCGTLPLDRLTETKSYREKDEL